MRSLDVVVLGSIDEDLGDLSSEILRVKAALLYGDRVSLTTHKIPLLLARMAVKARLAPKTMEAAGGLDPELAEELAQLLEARWAAEPPTGELAATNMAAMLGALRSDRPEVVLKFSEVLARRIREDDERQARDPSGWFRVVGRVAFENYARGREQDNPDRALRAVDELIKLYGASLVDISLGDAHELGYVELDELDQSFDRSVSEAIKLLANATQREHPYLQPPPDSRLGAAASRASYRARTSHAQTAWSWPPAWLPRFQRSRKLRSTSLSTSVSWLSLTSSVSELPSPT